MGGRWCLLLVYHLLGHVYRRGSVSKRRQWQLQWQPPLQVGSAGASKEPLNLLYLLAFAVPERFQTMTEQVSQSRAVQI